KSINLSLYLIKAYIISIKRSVRIYLHFCKETLDKISNKQPPLKISSFFTILIVSILVVFSEKPLYSQAYNRALGLRFDNGIGFTYKERLGDRFTVEGLLKARPK